MRRSYFLVLIMTMAACGSFFYGTYTPLCYVPVTYRLGELDARFNLSTDEAKKHLADAAAVWETAVGQGLFVYDESSDFPVNFIFDDRQERTIAEEAKRAALDQKESTSETVATLYKKLTTEYERKKVAFTADSTAYEAKLARFNKKVAGYNDAGGAPPAEFAALKTEEKKLAAIGGELQVRTATLAKLAADINAVSERGNALISQYNAGVADYNHDFGAPDEFTQGDYKGTNINIYKFSNPKELERVLAHEFGHALGVGHVEGTASIMYYLMEKQPETPVLSPEDTAALSAVCTKKTAISNWFYRLIDSLITLII